MPLFSILIPVYNVADYLPDCLNSIKDQAFSDYEVIAINDGSTDSCLEILNSFSDKLNIRIISKGNEGLLKARRDAISLATGKYCIFLDSDDLLEPMALSELDNIIENHEYDMVIYNLSYLNNNIVTKRKSPFKRDMVFSEKNKKILLEKMITTDDLNNLVIKCIKTEKLKMDHTDYFEYSLNSNGEDLIQSFNPVCSSNNIYFLDRYLYLYRQHNDSITKKIAVNELENQFSKFNLKIISIRKEHYNLFFETDKKKKVEKKMMFHHYKNIISFFFDTFCSCDRSQEETWTKFDWKSYLFDSKYINSMSFDFLGRIQLNSIIKRKMKVLRFFKLIRNIKNGVHHG